MHEINDVNVYSEDHLVVLLESEELGALAEAPAADVEAVLADDTAPPLANSAATLEGTLGIAARVSRNKVDWHGRKADQTARNRYSVSI